MSSTNEKAQICCITLTVLLDVSSYENGSTSRKVFEMVVPMLESVWERWVFHHRTWSRLPAGHSLQAQVQHHPLLACFHPGSEYVVAEQSLRVKIVAMIELTRTGSEKVTRSWFESTCFTAGKTPSTNSARIKAIFISGRVRAWFADSWVRESAVRTLH